VNGEQLYGLARLRTVMQMSRHPAMSKLSLKQRWATWTVFRESKCTRLDDQVYTNTFTPPWPSVAHDRFLESYVDVGTGTPRPVITNFAVTSLCPCKCWHCSFSNRDKAGILSADELKQAIADVQELGTSVIGLTGGEPLLRDDLEEILAAIPPKSAPLLFTTGWKLTRERVRALKDAGLRMPVVSLDHHTAERHDAGRGIDGPFSWACRAIELFRSEGLYVSVSFVPTRQLLDDREDFFRTIEFFRDLGVNDMRLTSPILSGKLTSRPDEVLGPEHVATIWEAQRMCTRTPGYPGMFAYDYFESESFYGCGAGYNYMFVDSRGNVCPCDFTMMSMGNIRERPIAEVWGEMSSRFHTPGCTCYATRIADEVAEVDSPTWPLGQEDSTRIHTACPSWDDHLPAFYRRMGFRRGGPGGR